jgi:hypothetical protein
MTRNVVIPYIQIEKSKDENLHAFKVVNAK